ncbi:MAG: hypothetical protein QM680_11045 [Luteolibacter sp.]
MKKRSAAPWIAVALGFLCVSPLFANRNPEVCQVSKSNDLSELKPEPDPNYDACLSICGSGLTDDFKSGYTIGYLRARHGKREWIHPIDSNVDSQSTRPLPGCREIHLKGYKETQALKDQIDGFNQAMWGAVIEDMKKNKQKEAKPGQ